MKQYETLIIRVIDTYSQEVLTLSLEGDDDFGGWDDSWFSQND